MDYTSKSVNCGMLADMATIIKSVSKVLVTALNKLYDFGMSVDSVKKTEHGGLSFDINSKDAEYPIHVECSPYDEDGKFDIDFSYKSKFGNTKIETKKGVTDKTFEKILIETLKKFGIEKFTLNESKSIKVGLQKIVSSDKIEIQLTNIYGCNIPYTQKHIGIIADEIINTALDNEEFIDNIPEFTSEQDAVPNFYELSETCNNDDSIYIDIIDIDTKTEQSNISAETLACTELLKAAIFVYSSLEWIKFAAKSERIYDYLASNANEYLFSDIIFNFEKICLKIIKYVPNFQYLEPYKTENEFYSIIQNYEGFDYTPCNKISETTAKFSLLQILYNFTDTINLLKINFDDGIQFMLNGILEQLDEVILWLEQFV